MQKKNMQAEIFLAEDVVIHEREILLINVSS